MTSAVYQDEANVEKMVLYAKINIQISLDPIFYELAGVTEDKVKEIVEEQIKKTKSDLNDKKTQRDFYDSIKQQLKQNDEKKHKEVYKIRKVIVLVELLKSGKQEFLINVIDNLEKYLKDKANLSLVAKLILCNFQELSFVLADNGRLLKLVKHVQSKAAWDEIYAKTPTLLYRKLFAAAIAKAGLKIS